MIPDDTYELCLPVLRDDALGDEEKTERLEELLQKGAQLSGKPLQNAVLDALWRYREGSSTSTSPPPSRHTVIRRPSPAPWQIARAPTPGGSPRISGPSLGFGVAPPAFSRAKSSTASPFTSPRPSPRLAFSSPHIPHSPSLSAYTPADPVLVPEIYGDLSSDAVDWLINDDSGSTASSSVAGETALNGAAAEWIQPPTMGMSPYDILRSVLGDNRPDDEIEKALESNGYDVSATILALMDAQALNNIQQAPTTAVPDPQPTYIVGKSMSPAFRPSTPLTQQKSNILCKYFLSSGHCARADCRFSHDPSKTLCKYFINGNCLAGETCLFSHDPSALVARLMLEGGSTPPAYSLQPNFQVHDYEAFPSLQTVSAQHLAGQLSTSAEAILEQIGSRPHSRPSSRHHSRAATPSAPSVDDNEAFPSLGSAANVKGGKRHHGKRGHGHGHKENGAPPSLADLVRMSPSPNPSPSRKGVRPVKSFNGSRENSAAAQAIPAPEHIPWLETGENANKAYLKARQEAFKHGGLRNKFLQSAAQAWNRNDSRAAKALSLRGQSENNLMREAHREAARLLYEERNKELGPNARELYVDLHGLHPEEAVSYLESILLKHQTSSRPIYAITGTGHHSKNGKDKVGKAIRGFLNEWRYAFREFSVPGDRNNVGGILGIDPSSWDRSLGERRAKDPADDSEKAEGGSSKKVDDTKVRILKREDVEKEREAQREAAAAAAAAGPVSEMEIPKGPRNTAAAGS